MKVVSFRCALSSDRIQVLAALTLSNRKLQSLASESPTPIMPPFTLYTFGSMSLGRNPADITQDVTVVRRVIPAA